MRGLKFIYYGMLLGLAAFLFTGTINLIISFGKFIVMGYIISVKRIYAIVLPGTGAGLA